MMFTGKTETPTCKSHRLIRFLTRLIVSEVRGTTTDLSAECAKVGIRLPASTIRSWINRGRLVLWIRRQTFPERIGVIAEKRSELGEFFSLNLL